MPPVAIVYRAVAAPRARFEGVGDVPSDPAVARDFIREFADVDEPLLLRVSAGAGSAAEREVGGDWFAPGGGRAPERVPACPCWGAAGEDAARWGSGLDLVDAWEGCDRPGWLLAAALDLGVPLMPNVLQGALACAVPALVAAWPEGSPAPRGVGDLVPPGLRTRVLRWLRGEGPPAVPSLANLGGPHRWRAAGERCLEAEEEISVRFENSAPGRPLLAALASMRNAAHLGARVGVTYAALESELFFAQMEARDAGDFAEDCLRSLSRAGDLAAAVRAAVPTAAVLEAAIRRRSLRDHGIGALP